jgi:hypothetical protein
MRKEIRNAMMNVTGVVLEVGQRLEVRIIDEAKEKAEQKEKNQNFLRELIQQLIDEELNANEAEDQDEEYDPFAELDAAEDQESDDIWFPLWNQMPEYEPEITFNYTKNRYRSFEKEIPNLYSYYGNKMNTDRDPGYEYRMLVKKWKENDPQRWQLVEEHNHIPTDQMWNEKRFTPGMRVELLWFLDEMPGYAYLKGKKGTVIKTQSKYVIVHFDGMNEQQTMIPGVLNKIGGDNKLPKLIDVDLIETERLGTGYTAWVAGYKSTWEFGMSKNEAIHKLLQTWYWNIKHQ